MRPLQTRGYRTVLSLIARVSGKQVTPDLMMFVVDSVATANLAMISGQRYKVSSSQFGEDSGAWYLVRFGELALLKQSR